MVSINYAFREICCKIVYYGPGLSGKTTNLIYIHKKAPPQTKGELISLATDADRTLYFDFLPLDIGKVQGFTTKFQLYTVPGQVYYNATRKLVLRGVDGLIFVADTQAAKMEENIESMHNLVENLEEYGYNLDELPMIMQYNKRDLEEVSSIEELERILNPRGLPHFEAVAVTGIGVFDTLKAISKMVLDKARGKSEPEEKKELVTASVQSEIPVSASVKKEESGFKPVPELVRMREPVVAGAEENFKRSESVDEVKKAERIEKKEKAEEAEIIRPIRPAEKIERIEKTEETKIAKDEKEKAEEREMVKQIKPAEKIEKIEITKEAGIVREEREEERIEKIEKEKITIQSQVGAIKESPESKEVLAEKVSEQPIEEKKETQPLIQKKVVVSPMLKRKRSKSTWGGFLWRWLEKITGRR
jgi:signal recognition particle receptor subunit beta